jgi:hypothetical protein
MTHPDERPAVTTEDMLSLEGIGWDGDLDDMRRDPVDRGWRSDWVSRPARP